MTSHMHYNIVCPTIVFSKSREDRVAGGYISFFSPLFPCANEQTTYSANEQTNKHTHTHTHTRWAIVSYCFLLYPAVA